MTSELASCITGAERDDIDRPNRLLAATGDTHDTAAGESKFT